MATEGVDWIQDAVEEIDPARHSVRTRAERRIGYDFLVGCPGLQIDWDKIVGLRDALTTPQGSSNYDCTLATKTWEMIRGVPGW
ncbi:MAG: hypothetical protein LH467_15305 [Gemmatimonadaceae bacterium]|nr:hypothetical protein [Gemmatimonadaceae bacterium]